MTEKEFKELFYARYDSFCNYANSMIKDEAGAEDIVQEVFIDFWKRQGSGTIAVKAEHYLIRAVKYKCIDYLRRQKVQRNYAERTKHAVPGEIADPEPDREEDIDLGVVIHLAIDQLPPKTREVFVLSKINRLSYREIATRLKISEKTVENQMSRAFKQLREKLKEYKFLWILIIYFVIR